MIHYYNYQPQTGRNAATQPLAQPETEQRHPLRSILKRLLQIFLVLALALLLVGGAGYLYITQTPLENTDDRTNILLLGVDEAASLSDTIMLVSIMDEPGSQPEVAITSFPRDMRVEVPDYGYNKINAAHAYGERYDHPDGGPGLTKATLEETLVTDIHYYAKLDFAGLKKLVDAAGGVEVDVPSSIDDPFYPAEGSAGYDPFQIDAGVQELDGETALRYARSRKTTDDFDRAARQQQVILALQDRILSDNGWPRPRRALSLLHAFESHVDTDLSRADMLKLALRLRDKDLEGVPRYVIDTTNFLVSSPTGDGSLVPPGGDYTEIQSFFSSVFTDPGIDEHEARY